MSIERDIVCQDLKAGQGDLCNLQLSRCFLQEMGWIKQKHQTSARSCKHLHYPKTEGSRLEAGQGCETAIKVTIRMTDRYKMVQE